MSISDQLRCLFTGKVEQHEGRYVVSVPEQEIQLGSIQEGQTYRVAILPEAAGSSRATGAQQTHHSQTEPEPPVAEGEQRVVEIEDIGEQGDGIARVERGYVVIVPDTEQGDRVSVEISEVRQNLAFADVVERHTHF